MPSLENRSIHLLGNFQSFPRRCLAMSYRSLLTATDVLTLLHTHGEVLIWLLQFSQQVCCLLLYQWEEKKNLTHLPLPFSFFSQKAASWSDGTLQCQGSIHRWFSVPRCLLETPTPMQAAWGTNSRIWTWGRFLPTSLHRVYTPKNGKEGEIGHGRWQHS